MSLNELHGFLALVCRTEALQVKLRQCTDPWQILELAMAHNYFLSYRDLRFGSGDLEGECQHWPWSGLGSQARRRLFLDGHESVA